MSLSFANNKKKPKMNEMRHEQWKHNTIKYMHTHTHINIHTKQHQQSIGNSIFCQRFYNKTHLSLSYARTMCVCVCGACSNDTHTERSRQKLARKTRYRHKTAFDANIFQMRWKWQLLSISGETTTDTLHTKKTHTLQTNWWNWFRINWN